MTKIKEFRDLTLKEMTEVRSIKRDRGALQAQKFIRKLTGQSEKSSKIFVSGLVTLD